MVFTELRDAVIEVRRPAWSCISYTNAIGLTLFSGTVRFIPHPRTVGLALVPNHPRRDRFYVRRPVPERKRLTRHLAQNRFLLCHSDNSVRGVVVTCVWEALDIER
jgi:hypothetical protein